MTAQKTFPNREQVAENTTWNLSDIFTSDSEYDEQVVTIQKLSKIFSQQFKNKLTNAQTVVKAVHEMVSIKKLASKLDHYAMLPVETNRQNSEWVLRQHRLDNVIQEVNTNVLFFETELKAATEELLDEVVLIDKRLTDYVTYIKRQQNIALSSEVEQVINAFNPVFNQPYSTYLQAKLADMVFPDFEVNKEVYPLSFVLYEDLYMYHDDTDVRRAAFDAFSAVLNQYKEGIASVYYTHVMQEKAEASLRGFDSVIDYLLYSQNVDRELYDRQIDGIMTELAPVMQKYITHVKEVRGLDKFTYADLKLDLDPEFSQSVTFEQSRAYVEEATQVLGKDYVESITRAYDERWVDYAQNQGKSTGGFCTMAAEVHPYILMSWTEQLSDVYTLIHELGHAGQMMAAEENNCYLTSEPSLYLIEAPSTFNELLLTGYLSAQAEDDRTQRFARTKMLTNTYFHNFVTHLLEAAYQREVYQLIDSGEAFTAQTLSNTKRDILQQFWGDAVDINPGAELTWMRQPHYYMGLYSYTYSAGLTIATQAYLNVRDGKEGAVESWLEFLTLGNMDTRQAAKVAGIDITTEEPLKATISFLDQTVDEIIAYTTSLNT